MKIGDLMKTNTSVNTELFAFTCRVIIRTSNLDKINTAIGLVAIKRDLYIQDETGFIKIQVFENQLREL